MPSGSPKSCSSRPPSRRSKLTFRLSLRAGRRLVLLGAAPTEEVMKQWAGLGYYSRARNLHACAKVVASEHGGIFPDREEALLALPGIGPYTAAAIAAIAFDHRATVVDGNVERVIARLFAIEEPLPGAKPLIKGKADLLTPDLRPGDYAQAMMDLGATICTPRSPACALCPLRSGCKASALGNAEPIRARRRRRRGPRAAAPPSFCAAPMARFWCARVRPRAFSAA